MPAKACAGCNKTSSSPHNFILTCNACSIHWHHRCHNPVVTDGELINMIHAFTSGNIERGITAWRCGGCMKGKGRADQPLTGKVGPPTEGSMLRSSKSAHNKNVGNASHSRDMSTDDDIMVIDDPQPSSTHRVTTHPTLSHSGTFSTPRPVNTAMIDLTLSSDEEEPVTSVRALHQSPTPPVIEKIAQKNIIPQVVIDPPPTVPALQSPRNSDPVPTIAQAVDQNESGSSHVPSQQHVNRPLTALPVKANLAPTWFHERWAAPIKEVDAWPRRRDPRRKITSVPSGDYSGDLFCFFASMWLEEQKKDFIKENNFNDSSLDP